MLGADAKLGKRGHVVMKHAFTSLLRNLGESK